MGWKVSGPGDLATVTVNWTAVESECKREEKTIFVKVFGDDFGTEIIAQ